VQPSGSISRGVGRSGNPHRGVAEAVAVKMAGDDEATVAGRVPTKNGYLSVTDHRVIWLDQRRTGFPGDPVTEFAADELSRVDHGKAPGLGNRSVRITFRDGAVSDLVVHRSQKPDELVEALRRLTG
jgi:hypothetical protein